AHSQPAVECRHPARREHRLLSPDPPQTEPIDEPGDNDQRERDRVEAPLREHRAERELRRQTSVRDHRAHGPTLESRPPRPPGRATRAKEPRSSLADERGGNPKRGRLIGLAVGAALLLSGCAGTTITKTGHETAGLYNIVLVMAAIVFVGVEAAIIYQVVKYRRRHG